MSAIIFFRYVQNRKIGKSNKLVLEAIKPKVLNRIINIG
jgi:hypothetical protein